MSELLTHTHGRCGATITEAMVIEGNVGNGYYGSGFEITVKKENA